VAGSFLGALLLCQGLLTLFAQVGCGGDSLHLLQNDNNQNDNASGGITVKGNIVNLPSAEHLAAFAFVNLRDPGTFRSFTDVKNDSLSDSKMSFEVRNLRDGNVSVYIVDNADRNDAVDAAERFALVADDDRRLRGLKKGDCVEIRDIFVDLDTGEAEPEAIIKNGGLCSGVLPTPTPTPTLTPTPEPTSS